MNRTANTVIVVAAILMAMTEPATAQTLGLGGVGQTAAADRPEPPTIELLVRDTAQVSDDVLTGAQTEAARIFREAGVETVWRALGSSPGNPAASWGLRLTIAILSHDQAKRLQSVFPRDGVGVGFAVPSSPTRRADMAYVFFHRVEDLTGANGVHLAPVLGAAMAHEIGHLLLDHAHSETGVMRADWTKADLQLAQRNELFFTAEQAERIRSLLAAGR